MDGLLKTGVLTGIVKKAKTRKMFLLDRSGVLELKKNVQNTWI